MNAIVFTLNNFCWFPTSIEYLLQNSLAIGRGGRSLMFDALTPETCFIL